MILMMEKASEDIIWRYEKVGLVSDKKKTISYKFTKFIILSVLCLFIPMVCIYSHIVNSYTAKYSREIITQACDAQTQKLDRKLLSVEQAVKNVYDVSEAVRPPMEKLKTDAQMDDFMDKFSGIALSIAQNTEGSLAVYYRIAPEFNNDGTEGFFFAKDQQTGEFEVVEPTDILAYSEDDAEHVGWYYKTKKAGRALWLDPYYNANIDEEMISYIIPVYDGDTFVGLVGMDVDFVGLRAITEKVPTYESSNAVIVCVDNRKIYFDKFVDMDTELSEEACQILVKCLSPENLLSYHGKAGNYKYTFGTLRNGMKVLVYAKTSDMYRPMYFHIWYSVWAFILIASVTTLIDIRVSQKLTKPILAVAEVTQKYAAGQWGESVECKTGDEVEILSDNINRMAEKTREYITYLNSLEKKDEVTGLRNKTNYRMYVDQLKDQAAILHKEYAIAVFTISDLKQINQEKGRETGDELLRKASVAICKYFSHSPVFRIGGDEFVAIIDGGDFPKKDKILEKFKADLEQMNVEINDADHVKMHIAAGLASSGYDGDNYEDVFEVADHRMYQEKLAMKEK